MNIFSRRMASVHSCASQRAINLTRTRVCSTSGRVDPVNVRDIAKMAHIAVTDEEVRRTFACNKGGRRKALPGLLHRFHTLYISAALPPRKMKTCLCGRLDIVQVDASELKQLTHTNLIPSPYRSRTGRPRLRASSAGSGSFSKWTWRGSHRPSAQQVRKGSSFTVKFFLSSCSAVLLATYDHIWSRTYSHASHHALSSSFRPFVGQENEEHTLRLDEAVAYAGRDQLLAATPGMEGGLLKIPKILASDAE